MAARSPPSKRRSVKRRGSPSKRSAGTKRASAPKRRRSAAKPTKKRSHRKLCARGAAAAKRKFEVWPSLHASAYASRVCLGEAPDASGSYRADPRYAAETEAIRRSGRLTGLQKAYRKRKYQFPSKRRSAKRRAA